MARPREDADLGTVKLRSLLGLVAGALTIAALVAESGTATAGGRCGVDTAGNGGYAYAGHQASDEGHGARATITLTRPLEVSAGHVAGWVGVGGPGQGPNGEDAWIQVGLGAVEGTEPFLYAEITRPGRYPKFILLDEGIQVGESHRVAVLEIAARPNWWRVWVDRKPVTKPVRILGSSGRWAPIATAESFNGGTGACNRFAYRFEQVLVSHGRGGAWKPFQSGHRFLDGGYRLQALATAPSESENVRSVSSSRGGPFPYAFLATS
jgi:hypothetical protein